ncbi:MAG: polysaccharide export protein [Brevundimonas sp.]|nr:MAG: polysaccharide export protein [Brevundimonas sp.]
MVRHVLVLTTLVAVAACGTGQGRPPATPIGEIQGLGPTSAANLTTSDYIIGNQDKLDVRVFRVEDLSFKELVVDAGGNIQLPLIGTIPASGRTAQQLADDIARALGDRYVRNPQVSVSVMEAASQKVTVDGAVTKPGVYVMQGRTSLLQAVAMAEGPSRVADLSKVAVFRNRDGQRTVAVFDLAAIRSGQAEDPMVLGDDVVVVDTSRLNVVLRNVVEALPAFAIFRNY